MKNNLIFCYFYFIKFTDIPCVRSVLVRLQSVLMCNINISFFVFSLEIGWKTVLFSSAVPTSTTQLEGLPSKFLPGSYQFLVAFWGKGKGMIQR